MSSHSSTRPTTNKDSRPRILIVDDEAVVRATFARFLGARGYDTVTVDSGAAAIAELHGGSFEVMLSDIFMPGMSGLELLTESLRIQGDLAVLMLTANSDANAATEAMSHGAMDYLVKPIELVELERAIVRAIHRRKLE